MNVKKKLLVTPAGVAAMFCMLATSAFAMDVYYAKSGVNLRTGPGTQFSIIDVVNGGDSVYRIEDSNTGWTYVEYNGQQGWVSTKYLATSQYISDDADPDIAPLTDRYTTSDVNLRGGPGTNYATITVVPGGSDIAVDSYSNGWAHTYYGGYEGYVSTSYISGLGGSTNNTGNTSSNRYNGNGTTWYGGNNYANVYDYRTYLAYNQDLAPVIGTDPNTVIAHFVNHGIYEGRQAISSFNVFTYRDQHPDLASQFGDSLQCYYQYACGIPLTA